MAAAHPLLRSADVQALHEEVRPHPLDDAIIRHTRSLGDAVGLKTLGVHLVRIEPRQSSSVQHTHHQEEEWVYVLSGRGIARIGKEEFEIGPGDFLGFVANSPAHCLHNPHDEDLVYIACGNRLDFDICDYPRAGKRRYRVNGKNVFVNADVLERGGEKLTGW